MSRSPFQTPEVQRIPKLEANAPKIKRTAGKGTAGVETWAAFLKVYPPYLVVQWPPIEPFEHHRLWEAAEGKGCLRSMQLAFPAFGRVVVQGITDGDGLCRSVQAIALPDPVRTAELLSLEDVVPLGWERLPQFLLGDLLMNRMRTMMLGASVFVYANDPDLWGGPDPVLAAWAATWRCLDGVPVFNRVINLDLCDPTTWNV